MHFSPLQAVGVALGSWVFYLTIRSYISRKALPPGPPGLPLIGNLFDVPKSQQWLSFIKMSQKYGSEIISLNIAGDTVIVLNSSAAVDALLESKSAIYSDRPAFHMLNDLVGYHWNFGFMRYGPSWKEHRRLLVQQFQFLEVLLHRPTELHAARILLQRLLDSPAKRERHLRHMAGMVILSTVYGIDVLPENDPHIDISEKALHAMASTGNRSFLVDSLPLCPQIRTRVLPGVGFKKQAREWAKAVDAMPVVPYEFVKKARVSRHASRRDSENSVENLEEQELVLSHVLGTVSALGTFILAMVMYPDVYRKAQAAVDDVVGYRRLPDFEDDIPYVDAIVREVLRWRPVLPLAIPHAVSEDDVYKGYHIPAGAIVLGKAWAIFNEEKTYGPNTDQFIPERWLTEDGYVNTEMGDSSAAFGFGRRICPGRDMAQWSVWITVASILATFKINKSLDNKGVPIEPSGEYTSGMIIYPVSHECDILPRSAATQALIVNALSTWPI
ncbi:cytochrome P450 [Mycena polygramma]|nr:cytochrome P450 [Mycena polygramma]